MVTTTIFGDDTYLINNIWIYIVKLLNIQRYWISSTDRKCVRKRRGRGESES